MKRSIENTTRLLFWMTLTWSLAQAANADLIVPDDDDQLLFDIYKELVETNTTHSSGDNTLAAKKMAARLRVAGFAKEAIFVGGPVEKKGNLVIRYKGDGSRKPLATDGAKMRNAGIPTYGVSGIFHDIDDIRAHGRDERLLIRSLYEGQEFLYRLVKALSQ
jgi:acetylornithine deacetylase/succinyl-diaminopimelate desuccinylase-like protein